MAGRLFQDGKGITPQDAQLLSPLNSDGTYTVSPELDQLARAKPLLQYGPPPGSRFSRANPGRSPFARQSEGLGTRHCFNSIADSRYNLLSLKPMHEVVALDPVARTVTVDAGITYGELCPYLDSKGFALHNLASLPHISIAGASSTATHGSGEKNGNLATAVSALEIVTAAGDVVKLSRTADGEVFLGAVVGLGALGVITRITLDIQPTYAVRQYVYEDLPLAQMKDHFDDIQSSAYSVSLFTDWQKQRIKEVWIKSRVGDGQAFADQVS